MPKSIMIFFILIIFSASSLSAMLTDEEGAIETKPPIALSSEFLENPKPGIYQSSDMNLILTFPLKHFSRDRDDLVIFDIDQVLITDRANPFKLIPDNVNAHFEELPSMPKHIKDSFELFLYASQSPSNIALMDNKTLFL